MKIKDREVFVANPKEAWLEIADMLSCGGKFYPTDLYTNSIINRAMAINDAYFRLTKLNNYVAAAPYIRMQMDNCISAYAGIWLLIETFSNLSIISSQVKTYTNSRMLGRTLFMRNMLCRNLTRYFQCSRKDMNTIMTWYIFPTNILGLLIA